MNAIWKAAIAVAIYCATAVAQGADKPNMLIIWGDVPWFVHSILIIGIASKLQLAWAFWNRVAA